MTSQWAKINGDETLGSSTGTDGKLNDLQRDLFKMQDLSLNDNNVSIVNIGNVKQPYNNDL